MNEVHAQGKLVLVGLGPGDPGLVTPNALASLEQCDVIVGYRGYIDQLGNLGESKELIAMELGQELERASRAVDLAYARRSVAVVSSGDAGIYGMAGPVFRVLADRGWDGETPRLEVVPGISALQSAAALLGSPLMQDFCAISLSDLLTPWEAIRRRIEAAAQGDFVVALYNPRSRGRPHHLERARALLLAHRSPDTPVGVVTDAYRPGQRVTVTTLGDLDPETVGMTTVVIVGASSTRLVAGGMVTPRRVPVKQT